MYKPRTVWTPANGNDASVVVHDTLSAFGINYGVVSLEGQRDNESGFKVFPTSQPIYLDIQGNPVKTTNCVRPDNQLTSFILTVRSLRHIGEGEIKQIIGRKFEPVSVEEISHTMIVR